MQQLRQQLPVCPWCQSFLNTLLATASAKLKDSAGPGLQGAFAARVRSLSKSQREKEDPEDDKKTRTLNGDMFCLPGCQDIQRMAS